MSLEARNAMVAVVDFFSRECEEMRQQNLLLQAALKRRPDNLAKVAARVVVMVRETQRGGDPFFDDMIRELADAVEEYQRDGATPGPASS
jgi:hypothetical protein